MMMDAMALFAMFTARITAGETSKKERIPEPEFKPFRFEGRDGAAVRAEAMVPANTAHEPRTLEELGVPGPLARELEAAFRVLGDARSDRVTGFTFRAEDGTRYALKAPAAPAGDADELAA